MCVQAGWWQSNCPASLWASALGVSPCCGDSVWHPTDGSLSCPKASCRDRRAARRLCWSFSPSRCALWLHTRMQNLPARAVWPPHSSRLQHQPPPPPLQELQHPHTALPICNPCTRVLCSLKLFLGKGVCSPLSKAIERLWVLLLQREVCCFFFFSFWCYRTLSRGALTVVKPLLEEYTNVWVWVCVCRCTKTFGRFFFISEDLSPCLSLYIVGLNLARRYCVYLAALFCTKLGLEEAGVHLVPPVKKKKKFLWLMMLNFIQCCSRGKFYFSNIFFSYCKNCWECMEWKRSLQNGLVKIWT